MASGDQHRKGYIRRQEDKHTSRQKHIQARKKQKQIRQGEIRMKNQRQELIEVRSLAEELRQAELNRDRYKTAWETEKTISKAFREQNRELQQEIREMKRTQFIQAVFFSAIITLMIASIIL